MLFYGSQDIALSSVCLGKTVMLCVSSIGDVLAKKNGNYQDLCMIRVTMVLWCIKALLRLLRYWMGLIEKAM